MLLVKYFAKTISFIFKNTELTSFLNKCLGTNTFPRQLKKSPFKKLLFQLSLSLILLCIIAWFSKRSSENIKPLIQYPFLKPPCCIKSISKPQKVPEISK